MAKKFPTNGAKNFQSSCLVATIWILRATAIVQSFSRCLDAEEKCIDYTLVKLDVFHGTQFRLYRVYNSSVSIYDLSVYYEE